jgi:hypothetical protein
VVLVGASLLFAFVVQSGLFTSSNWMLGDLAYHRGVAYTMDAGSIWGEGPYRGLISYYGGLFPLAFGLVSGWLGISFDRVLSVVSWFGGPAWVLAAFAFGRRLWPADRATRGAFVLIATVAVPFSRDETVTWVNSTLASSQAYWPLYPRDAALILLVLCAAALLSANPRRRVVLAGTLIGLEVMLHVQLAILTGWLVVAWTAWAVARGAPARRLLEVPATAGIALVLSAWWWVPRIGPTLATHGSLLADYPGGHGPHFGLDSYMTAMGPAGLLSAFGFSLLVARRFRSPASTLILVWAASLLPLIALDRVIHGLDLISERRVWLVFSIPALAAAAVAAVGAARASPRPIVAAAAVAAALAILPGTGATLGQIRSVWPAGQLGLMSVDPTTWRPVMTALRARTKQDHGLVLGTYDAYGAWAWSFSGAQPISLWLPGWLKLGFDPASATGLSYEERLNLERTAFAGQGAMCAVASRTDATVFLLDRRSGLVATYDRTPAMDFRVDPRDRNAASIRRTVEPGLKYRDNNTFDELDLARGGSYALPWSDPAIRMVTIEAVLPANIHRASLLVSVGDRVRKLRTLGDAPVTYVVETPNGVVGGLVLTADADVRLFRVSGYVAVAGAAGPDGPFLIETQALCQ